MEEELSDELWKEFVNSLNLPNNTQNVANITSSPSHNLVCDNKLSTLLEEEGDDPNDPDYNWDKDLQNFDADDDFDIDDYLNFLNDPNENILIESTDVNSIHCQTNENGKFTSRQMFVLQEQLRFHVQTLTQTWMLSSYCDTLQSLNTESKQMMLELKDVFQNEQNNDDVSSKSGLVISNLQSAIHLVEKRGNEISKAEKRFSFGMASDFSRKLISSRRDIFIFDWAFPIKRFTLSSLHTKVKFNLAEDFLLATSLSEHPKSIRIHNHFCQKIQEKYMSLKSIISISSHIKHLKRLSSKMSSSKAENDSKSDEMYLNPIVYYFRENKLLAVNSCFDDPDADTYRKYRRPPKWFRLLVSEKDDKDLLIDENDGCKENFSKKSRLIKPKNTVHSYNQNHFVLQTVANPSYISTSTCTYVSTIVPTISSYPMTIPYTYPCQNIEISMPTDTYNSDSNSQCLPGVTSNIDFSTLTELKKSRTNKRNLKRNSVKNKKICVDSITEKTNIKKSVENIVSDQLCVLDATANILPSTTSITYYVSNPVTFDTTTLLTTQSHDQIVESCNLNAISENKTVNFDSFETELGLNSQISFSDKDQTEQTFFSSKVDSSILRKAFEEAVLNDTEELCDNEIIEETPYNEEFVEEDEELEEDDEYIVDEESELVSSDKISTEEDAEGDECKFNSRDNENDLMALMEASWTAVTNRARHSQTNDGDSNVNCVKRKSDIITRQRNTSLFILQKELLLDSNDEEDRKELLIHYYLKKAQKILSHDEYVQFLQMLVGFLPANYESGGNKVNLTDSLCLTDAIQIKTIYHKIKQFLVDLHSFYLNKDTTNDCRTTDGIQELIELLVLFLDFFQAHACGESFNYLYWKRVFDFLRKVEHYLTFVYSKRSQQLGCIQRLIKSLNQINQHSLLTEIDNEETKTKIKSVVSKILNGQNLLIDEFSSLFLDDSPVRYLYSNSEDFDEFTLVKDNLTLDMELNLENVHLPIDENDLKYSTSQCPCNCHLPITQTSENSKHCPSCAIRFIAGRIYLPHFNSFAKKVQLIEYINNANDTIISSPKALSIPVKPLDQLNSQTELNQTEQNIATEWTMAEDRMLLEACRSIILDSHITQLNEQVFESVAKRLAEQFEQSRTTKQLCGRLHQLIEMLTTCSSKSTSVEQESMTPNRESN